MFKISLRAVDKKSFLLLVSLYTFICLAGALFVSSLLSRADYSQGAFVIFSMCEIALILFITPLIAVNKVDSALRGAMVQFLSTQGSPIKISWELLRYPLLIAFILCLIPALLGFILKNFLGAPPAIIIFKTFFIALAIALAALSIGFYASIICKNALSSAGLALLFIILICTEPIWFGPVISKANTSLIVQFSLLINPFVNAASALNFDILRMDPLYEICPIGQLRFQYPAFWLAVSFNLSIALVLFWRFNIGVRRMLAPSA
jgi:hypothetical protein